MNEQMRLNENKNSLKMRLLAGAMGALLVAGCSSQNDTETPPKVSTLESVVEQPSIYGDTLLPPATDTEQPLLPPATEVDLNLPPATEPSDPLLPPATEAELDL